MKKKVKSIIVWGLLAIVGAWIVIIANMVLYLQVGFERLSLTVAVFFFLAVFCLVVKAVHILGLCITNKIYQRNEKTFC